MVAGCLCIQCKEWLKHIRSDTISIWCHARHWHPEWSQSTQGYWTWRGSSSPWRKQLISLLRYWAFYRQSIVLVEWRKANVVPPFKKCSHASSAYYRPVYMTSICSKVMEHIISSQIMIQAYKILLDAQQCFRKKRWCEMQFLLSHNDFLKLSRFC